MSKTSPVDRHQTFVDWLRTTFPKLYEKHYKNPPKPLISQFKLKKISEETAA